MQGTSNYHPKGQTANQRALKAVSSAAGSLLIGILIAGILSCGGASSRSSAPEDSGAGGDKASASEQTSDQSSGENGESQPAQEPQPAAVLRSLSLYDKPGKDRSHIALMKGGETVQWTGRTQEGPDSKGNMVPFLEIKRDDRTGWTYAAYLAPGAEQALLLQEAEIFSGPGELKFLDEAPLQPRTLIALDPEKTDPDFQHIIWVPDGSWWRREAWIRQDAALTKDPLDIAVNLRIKNILEKKELSPSEKLSKLSLLAEKDRYQDSPLMDYLKKEIANLEETAGAAPKQEDKAEPAGEEPEEDPET